MLLMLLLIGPVTSDLKATVNHVCTSGFQCSVEVFVEPRGAAVTNPHLSDFNGHVSIKGIFAAANVNARGSESG